MKMQTEYDIYLKKECYKEEADPEEIVQVSQLEVLPVCADLIHQACQRDPITYDRIHEAWVTTKQ